MQKEALASVLQYEPFMPIYYLRKRQAFPYDMVKFEGLVIRPNRVTVFIRYLDASGCWHFKDAKPEQLEMRQ